MCHRCDMYRRAPDGPARSEAWLQGHYDARNNCEYKPGGYDATEYDVGWKCGKTALRMGWPVLQGA